MSDVKKMKLDELASAMQKYPSQSVIDEAARRLREMDHKPQFGVNYYTQDITQRGSPVVGCGIIKIELDDSHGPEADKLVVTVRTENGDEFDTWPDCLHRTHDAARAAQGVKG